MIKLTSTSAFSRAASRVAEGFLRVLDRATGSARFVVDTPRIHNKALALGLLLLAQSAFAATPSGTTLTNTAAASYRIAGTAYGESASASVVTEAGIQFMAAMPGGVPTPVGAAQCASSGSTSGPFDLAGGIPAATANLVPATLYGSDQTVYVQAPGRRPPLPPQPEYDLLWFIANYAPDLEDWERDIFLAVREESFYFYPVFACQIMNEGWASYWHARLLRDAAFLPQRIYVEAIKAHSDVVRPYAGDEHVALQVNPYHLGFSMWEEIVERQGLDQARRIMMADDDFSFVRNYLSEDLAAKLQLFRYAADSSGHIKVQERDLDALRETLIANKFNFGAPRISADAVQSDGTLVLRHDHRSDGRGLDLARARKVLGYVHSLWRRPVVLHTVNDREQEAIVTAGAADGRVV